MTEWTPTDEQYEALGAFRLGLSLQVQALAGSGKTSTLRLMGESTRRIGQFVAFNRKVVEDATGAMPANVACSTVHSLAFRAVGRSYAHRIRSPRMRSSDIARKLKVERQVIRFGSQTKVLQPGFMASLAMRAVNVFCQTGDELPGPEHVPYVEGIDVPQPDGERGWANNLEVRKALIRPMEIAWADLCSTKGDLPYSHGHYLKLWQLRNPRIPGDFILLDEAQDMSGVMLAAVLAQSAQLVAVGDSYQQLYEWLGAVDALNRIPTEATAYLTTSWRFGPPIASVANRVLDLLGSEIHVTGGGGPSSVQRIMNMPDAVLCRSNAEAVRKVLTYMAHGVRVHLVGGAHEVASFAKAAGELQSGSGWTSHPELACFTSWTEVQAYVDQDPQGGELKLLVGLVDEFGVDVILGALEHMPGEEGAQVVVSTAHVSKGREWNRVQLAGDFQEPENDGGAEWRLLYVAATRAKATLDVSLCEPLSELLYGPKPKIDAPALNY